MRKVALLILLVFLADLRIALPASAMTVVLDFDQPYSPASLNAMKAELRTLLKPVGLSLDLQLKSDLKPHASYGDLMLFKMRGACTMEALPVGAVLDERGTLGATLSSDGELMPFGQVDCDRVRASIQRVLGQGDPQRHQLEYGFALSLVMAHEMYHIITRSAAHTTTGVTKQSLSARDLLDRIGFSRNAELAMRESLRQRNLQ